MSYSERKRGLALLDTLHGLLAERWNQISGQEYKEAVISFPGPRGQAYTYIGPSEMKTETWRISFVKGQPAVMLHWHWETGFDWWREIVG